jgi:hypothetical protein
MTKDLDLSSIMQSVTEKLSDSKDELNQADSYNHDHGDHMVQIFNLIQNAVSDKKDQPVADQLQYASQVVEKEAHSGSAQLYAQNLSTAAQKFSGTSLNTDTVGVLIQSLLGAEKPKPAAKPKPQGFLTTLLSGLMGSAPKEEVDDGLGIDDLLQAGLSFYQSKQEGDDPMQALLGSLMATSPMGQSSHREQSGSLIVSTIMDFLKSMNK